jgi:hypothetical protein
MVTVEPSSLFCGCNDDESSSSLDKFIAAPLLSPELDECMNLSVMDLAVKVPDDPVAGLDGAAGRGLTVTTDPPSVVIAVGAIFRRRLGRLCWDVVGAVAVAVVVVVAVVEVEETALGFSLFASCFRTAMATVSPTRTIAPAFTFQEEISYSALGKRIS